MNNIKQGENHNSAQLPQHSESQNERNRNELFVDCKDELKIIDDDNNMTQESHCKLLTESSEASHGSNCCQSEHLRTRTNTTQKHYHCNKCSKRFVSLYNLQRHEKFHNGLQHFKCNFCCQRFYQSDMLKTHVEKIHYGKTFKCHLCEKSYPHKASLKRHLEYHTRHYQCERCKKKFSKFTVFTKHKRNCMATIKHNFAEQEGTSEKELFKCNSCGIKFTLFQSFKRHVKTHFKKQYKCAGSKLHNGNTCGMQFRTKRGLDCHKVVHTHPKMKSSDLKCKVCHRTFSKKSNLKRHQLTIHRKESAYSNETKWKEMYVKNTMDGNDNERGGTSHSQEGNRRQLYTCHVCQKKFSRLCNLEQHMSSGHLQDDGVFMNGKLTDESTNTNSLQKGNPTGKQSCTCNVCHKKFSQPGNLKHHMLSRHGTFVGEKLSGEPKHVERNKDERTSNRTKKLRCKLCQKMFSNDLSFKQHWKMHSPNNGPFECGKWEDVCEPVEIELKIKSLNVVSQANNEDIIPQKVRRFKCKTCQQILCDNLHKFKRHWSLKHSEKQVPSDKNKWKKLYEVIEVECTMPVDDTSEDGVRKFRCKVCKKILCCHLGKFQRHWFARHANGKVAPSDPSKWKELYELVNVEVNELQANENITVYLDTLRNEAKQNKKKFKCKSCEKILCRRYKFKRHWLTFHALESNLSQKWEVMYELVEDTVDEAGQTEKGNFNGVKKVRCKVCEKILCGRLHKYQRHWFAKHSKHSNGNVPSDYRTWRELYELVKVENLQDVSDNADARDNVSDKENLKKKTKRRKTQAKRSCENGVSESTGIEESAEKIYRRRKRQCKVCKKMLCSCLRHGLSAHPEETASPPGVSNVEIKCECEESLVCHGNEERACLENGKPQFSREFENTCVSELSQMRGECEGNSCRDGIERTICVPEKDRCLEDGTLQSSGRLDEACPFETITIKEECQCGDEHNSVVDAVGENIWPPEQIGCLEDGTSQFSGECEDEQSALLEDGTSQFSGEYEDEQSACLEDGTFLFSGEYEDGCRPEVSKVKVKCPYVDLPESLSTHEFETSEKCICPQCGELLNSAKDLIQHDVDDH